MTRVPSHAWNPPTNGATYVSIEGHLLQGIYRGDFVGLPGLVSLRVPNNKITIIETGAFQMNTVLEFLDFDQNMLQVLGPDVFPASTAELGLAENRISEVCSDGKCANETKGSSLFETWRYWRGHPRF